MSMAWMQVIGGLLRAPSAKALHDAVVAGLVQHTGAQEAWLFLFDRAGTDAQLAAHRRRDDAPADGTETQLTAPLARAGEAEGSGGWIRCLFRRPVQALDVAGVTTAASVFDTVAASHRAREQERLRDGWTALVAHDLRQPLLSLRLQIADVADGDPLLAASLERSLTALARMTNDLGDGIAAELGHLTLERVETDIGALLDGIVLRTPPVHERPIRVELEGPVPRCWVDPVRIEQVVGNLLVNAQKYGDPGTPIHVRVKGNSASVRIAVHSAGAPIPYREHSRLFERFYRASREAVRGLGLGLYICKELVVEHGGRIWVETKQPRDNAFCFTLPVRAGRGRAAT